jgi:hypothetical protein
MVDHVHSRNAGALLWWFAALAAGCAHTSTPPVQGTAPTEAKRSAEAGMTLTLALGGESTGTACAAVPVGSRLAVTALHCLRETCAEQSSDYKPSLGRCEIAFSDSAGRRGTAYVAKQSPDDELALLELSSPRTLWASVRCADPMPGEAMHTVGHPSGHSWTSSYGRLERPSVSLEWADGVLTRVVVASIATAPGLSGAGLFDASDQLVGIMISRWSAWTRTPELAAAVHSARVRVLLESYCALTGGRDCPKVDCGLEDAPLFADESLATTRWDAP